MPFCNNCGKENAVGARFCNNCGAPQQAAAPYAPAPQPQQQYYAPPPPPPGPKKPALLRLLTILNIVSGIFLIIVAFSALSVPRALAGGIILGLFLLIVGSASLAVSYGILKLLPWVWLPAFATAICVLGFGVLTLITGVAVIGLPYLAFGVFSVYYLWGRDVKLLLGRTKPLPA